MSRQIPLALQRLRKVSSKWGFFAGDFELDDADPERVLAWFGGRAKPASKFVAFGHEKDGGLYALWFRDRRTVNPPVVLLGSEGDARVLAPSVLEFFSLLALDLMQLGVFEDFSSAPAKTPGHRKFLAWLRKEGVTAAQDPEGVVAAARLAYPGLASFIRQAMSGTSERPRARRTSAIPAAHTELPTDPIALLAKPRPAFKISDKSGLQLTVGDDGLVGTVFVKRGPLSSALRPLGIDLFSLRRPMLLKRLGAPTKTAAGWDRFDRGDAAIHLQYGKEDEVALLTLMWIPALPPHLR